MKFLVRRVENGTGVKRGGSRFNQIASSKFPDNSKKFCGMFFLLFILVKLHIFNAAGKNTKLQFAVIYFQIVLTKNMDYCRCSFFICDWISYSCRFNIKMNSVHGSSRNL